MKNLLVIILAITLVGVFTTPDEDQEETDIVFDEPSPGPIQVRIGQCFNDEPPHTIAETVELSGYGGVACNQPHDSEIFAQTQMTHKTFPGEATTLTGARYFCMTEFEAFIGSSFITSIFSITVLHPSHQTWIQFEDREVSCAAYHMRHEKLVGSVRGIGI